MNCIIIKLCNLLLQGPFVQVDELLTLLQKVDLDNHSPTGSLSIDDYNNDSCSCLELANITKSSTSSRKRPAGQDQDGKEDGQNIPQNDIYRARQQKRVHLATITAT